jgi:hypothetical protein
MTARMSSEFPWALAQLIVAIALGAVSAVAMTPLAILLGALTAVNIGLALRTVWKEWRSWRQPATDRQAEALDAINHAVERVAVALETR